MNPYFRGAITVAIPKTKEEMYEVYTWQPLQGFKKKNVRGPWIRDARQCR
jgi:hypothetical protein